MATEYGLDVEMFRFRIVKPVLLKLELHSPAAENLVLGTALHESHLKFLQQIRGPAKGVFQMEPATYADLWANFLAYQPKLAAVVRSFAIGDPDAEEMEGNLYFACAMCRIHYKRVRAPLPENDPHELALYWKKYYNTLLGRGTIEQALPHFTRACHVQ